MKSYEKHGSDWKKMSIELGKSRIYLKDLSKILSQRYCPNLLEAREAYENKVPV